MPPDEFSANPAPACRVESADGRIELHGSLTLATLEEAAPRIEAAVASQGERGLRLALGGLVQLDTAGAVFIRELVRRSKGTVEVEGLAADLDFFYAFVPPRPEAKPPAPAVPWLERFGGRSANSLDQGRAFFFLMSDLTWDAGTALWSRNGLRRGAFTDECIAIGYRSLPIIALILFLIGAVSALQSAAQLRQFGADILVADLLAIGIFKELGPLMAAIIVSGRSGSAIAAEVATMKFNEELDALDTMGVDSLRFVAVPKLWAMLVSLPLLTVVADLVGVLGGVFVSITSLQVPPLAFIERAIEAVILQDILTGLCKSVTFAWAITLIAVHFGLQARGGPAGVGRATTAAVVASLFGIILLDSLWGLLFHLR